MPTLRQQHPVEYKAFEDAKFRCRNKKYRRYADYGGRGIEFRFATFADFLAELGPRPDGLTLERIDNNGHYEKNNVKWATKTEQMRNRRTTRLYRLRGEDKTLKAWADEYGFKYKTLYTRIRRGLSLEQAIRFRQRKSPTKQ